MDFDGAFENGQDIAQTLTIQAINEQQLAIQNLYGIISSLKARIHELEGKTDVKTCQKNDIDTNPSVESVVSQNMRRRLFEENTKLRQQVETLTKENSALTSKLQNTLDAFSDTKNTILSMQQALQELHEKERQWQQEKSLIHLRECYCAKTERDTSALSQAFQKAATENMDWRSLCWAIATRVEPASLRKYVIDQIECLEEKYTCTEGTVTTPPMVRLNTLTKKCTGSRGYPKNKSRFLVPL